MECLAMPPLGTIMPAMEIRGGAGSLPFRTLRDYAGWTIGPPSGSPLISWDGAPNTTTNPPPRRNGEKSAACPHHRRGIKPIHPSPGWSREKKPSKLKRLLRQTPPRRLPGRLSRCLAWQSALLYKGVLE